MKTLLANEFDEYLKNLKIIDDNEDDILYKNNNLFLDKTKIENVIPKLICYGNIYINYRSRTFLIRKDNENFYILYEYMSDVYDNLSTLIFNSSYLNRYESGRTLVVINEETWEFIFEITLNESINATGDDVYEYDFEGLSSPGLPSKEKYHGKRVAVLLL